VHPARQSACSWPQYLAMTRCVKRHFLPVCSLIEFCFFSCCCLCCLCCVVPAAVVLATFYVMRSWSMWLGRTRRRGMAPELAGFGALGAQVRAPAGPNRGGLRRLLLGALCSVLQNMAGCPQPSRSLRVPMCWCVMWRSAADMTSAPAGAVFCACALLAACAGGPACMCYQGAAHPHL
jgi:hypothetical protein